MKDLIDFICSIYGMIALGIAMALISTMTNAGFSLLHPWVLWLAFGIHATGFIGSVYFRNVSHEKYFKALIASLSMSLFLAIGLGALVMMGDSAIQDSSKLDELSGLIPRITEVIIIILSLAPVLSTWGDADNYSSVKSSHRPASTRGDNKDINLVTKLTEFLSYRNNHLLLIGSCRTGKSLLIKELTPKENIICAEHLYAAENRGEEVARSLRALQNTTQPIAIDEAHIIQKDNFLYETMELLNDFKKSYILCLQDFMQLSQSERDIFFKANTVRIIYLERVGDIKTVDDISWRELTRYEVEKASYADKLLQIDCGVHFHDSLHEEYCIANKDSEAFKGDSK